MDKERRKIPLFLLATFMFGWKTYIVYRFVLQIEIDNYLQELIILLNQFIASFIFFGLSIWFQSTHQPRLFIRYSALVGTIIIYFNLLFYRSFTDFLTIPQFFQMSNLADLSSSIFSLLKIYDLLLIIDVVLIWYLSKS